MPPGPTDQLLFRPWSPALREDFAAMARDPEVVRHIPPGLPWSEERIDGFVARQQRHEHQCGFSMWWLGTPAGSPLGLCGLQPVPDREPIEIGWWLRPQHQGRGMASAAARVVLDWAWAHTDLDQILAHTVVANVGSIAVMRRLGMEDLGVVPAAEHRRPGIDFDLVVFRARRRQTAFARLDR